MRSSSRRAVRRAMRFSDDLNGAVPEGFGAFQTNIDHGVRASTAHAYLRAAAGRPNLAIETRRPGEPRSGSRATVPTVSATRIVAPSGRCRRPAR